MHAQRLGLDNAVTRTAHVPYVRIVLKQSESNCTRSRDCENLEQIAQVPALLTICILGSTG